MQVGQQQCSGGPGSGGLTAASYRYFVRGPTEKPGPDDVRVREPGMKRLAPYDHMLRKFQCVLHACPQLNRGCAWRLRNEPPLQKHGFAPHC